MNKQTFSSLYGKISRPFNGYTCPSCCNQTFELITYPSRYSFGPDCCGVLICANCGRYVKMMSDSECQQFNHA